MGRAPFISGYTEFAVHTFEMGKYLAFDLRTLDQSVLAGTPPGQLGAMLGDFDPTATDAALENCVASVPDCTIAIHQSHEGISFYFWGEDLAMDLTRVLVPPAFDRLGRGGRIAVQDSHVFYTVETPGMEALIETSLAKRPSLLDSKQFRLLAKAMTQLDAHASFLSDQTMSVEDAIDKIGGKNMSQEHVEQIRAQVMATPMLKPYLAFATGEGVDQVGPYMALALVHANAETAEENVNLLLRRINEASSLMTRQQWAEMVDRTEVRADGPIFLAKLHGRISRAWAAMVFNRDSLLFHEGTVSSNHRSTTPVQAPATTAIPMTDTASVQAAVPPAPAVAAAAEAPVAEQPITKEEVVAVAEAEMVSEPKEAGVEQETVQQDAEALPPPIRHWEIDAVQVDGATVTVWLLVEGAAIITVSLNEGWSQVREFPSEIPPVFVFHDVPAGNYTIRVRDESGHDETVEITVP